jgi:Ser/Thr protein kinase RdoA (MazF antagonist)
VTGRSSGAYGAVVDEREMVSAVGDQTGDRVDGREVGPPVGAWASVVGDARVEVLARGHALVFAVRAGDGRRYVVKTVGPGRPGPPVADEYRVLVHLRDAGVPVAVPVVSDDGRVAVRGGGVDFALLPWLDGVPGGREAGAACGRVGAAIGRLHRALAGQPWPVRSFRQDMVAAFQESRERLPAEVRRRTVEPLAERVLAALSGLAALPEQRLHGDCGPGNVLVRGGDVAGFIDLDHLPAGPRLYDLAYYLAHRARDGALLDVAARYVAGYRSVNPLAEAELAALPAAVLGAQLSITEWSHRLLTEMPERALPDQPERYRRGVAALDWIAGRYDDLAAALRGADGPFG